MQVFRVRFATVLGTLAVLAGVVAVGQADAASSNLRVSTYALPAGSTATISTNGGFSVRNRLGIVVRSECSCDDGKGGSCSVSISGSSLNCYKKASDTCKSSCSLTTTTSGGLSPY